MGSFISQSSRFGLIGLKLWWVKDGNDREDKPIYNTCQDTKKKDGGLMVLSN